MTQNRKELVESLTIGEMQKFVDITFTITGAKGMVELYSMLESRFNSTDDIKLEAIPLGDWCKDNNYSRPRVFKLLTKLGFIDNTNRITPKYIATVHPVENEDELVPFSELVLFNSKRIDSTYTLMVRPNAVAYNKLADILKKIPQKYIGSKGLSPKQLKSVNSPINSLINWRA